MTMAERKQTDADIIEALPPAQLAQDLPNGCTDTISRAAALSALNGLTEIYLNNLPPTIDRADAVDAIKALPSATVTNVGGTDTISRQAALEAMETWDKFGCDPDGKLVRYDDDKHYIPYVHYEDMVHAIKHMPPTQPGWIPCSTALPSEYDNYIITTEDGMVVFGVYDPREEQWSRYDSIKSWWLYGIKVLAWQPKPKPWEGGRR